MKEPTEIPPGDFDTIPPSVLESHVAILGKTGAGKTTAAKCFAEQILEDGLRLCAVDPTGVWYGLRMFPDGSPAVWPRPLVIFGGPHGDIPIDGESGERLAEVIAADVFSSIVDTSDLTVGKRTKFFTNFAETLLRKNRSPLHLFIDEAHLFAPQARVPDPQSGRMLHAANNLVSGGRARGLRVMLLSQRAAKLHKDSLTQVETLVAMRLNHPLDRAAVEDWIGEAVGKGGGRELVAALPGLPQGDGFVWSPEADYLRRLHFPMINTADTSAPPKAGEVREVPAASFDLEAVRAALGVEAPEHFDDDPPPPFDASAAVEAAYADGFREGGAKNESAWRSLMADLDAILEDLAGNLLHARNVISLALGGNGNPGDFNTLDAVQRATFKAAFNEHNAVTLGRIHDNAVVTVSGRNGQSAPRVKAAEKPAERAPRPAKAASSSLSTGAAGLLSVLVRHHPARLTWAQACTLGKRRARGGYFNTARKALLEGGFVREESDGAISVMAFGFDVSGGKPKRPTKLFDAYREALPGPANAMLERLDMHGPMTAEELAKRLDLQPRGGHWNTGIAMLERCGLITRTGGKIALRAEALR